MHVYIYETNIFVDLRCWIMYEVIILSEFPYWLIERLQMKYLILYTSMITSIWFYRKLVMKAT